MLPIKGLVLMKIFKGILLKTLATLRKLKKQV
jgi:hypothetical protein